MSFVHKELAAGRWFELDLVEQLANVGSEVERTIRGRETGRREYSDRAFERAMELLGLTIADPKNRGRLREVCRAQELLADYFFGNNQYGTDDGFWRRYFLGFAWCAQLRRHNAARAAARP